MSRKTKISALLILALFPAACSSVKVPDIVDLPGFSETAENIDEFEYPNPNQAPESPDDIPSAEEWDRAAKAIMNRRDSFDAPADFDSDMTAEEIKKEIEALRRKVKEYEIDDPVVF